MGPEATEAVAEHLRTLGAAGVAIETGDGDPVVVGYYPPGAGGPDRLPALRRFLCCLAGWGLNPGRPRAWVELLALEDWQAASRRAFRPFRVGRRLWIVPAGEGPDLPPAAVAVRLDPGLAFGTGDHPTTRMCLEEIEAAVSPGDTVLDCGTGSGVLAIAAALLGAVRVRAVDHDPVAVAAACQAVTLNGLAGRIQVDHGDARDWLRRQLPAQLVVANLDTASLLGLAHSLPPAVAPGGQLIVSGLSAGRNRDVAAALVGAGLEPRGTRSEEGWGLVTAGKPWT